MEAYIDVNGSMNPEFLKAASWNVFVKFLLTQVDCLCFLLSWCIAIYLAICRAILFFFVDAFPGIKDPLPQPSIDRSSSPIRSPKSDDDDCPPRDGKPAADKKLKLIASDSGVSLSSSSASESPVHHDVPGKVEETKTVPSVVTVTDKDLKSKVPVLDNTKDS